MYAYTISTPCHESKVYECADNFNNFDEMTVGNIPLESQNFGTAVPAFDPKSPTVP